MVDGNALEDNHEEVGCAVESDDYEHSLDDMLVYGLLD